MKVILYMAITPNGLIAKENDDVSFVSKVSWRGYLKNVKKAGCAIIGRRTYEVMSTTEFVKGALYIVLTHNKKLKKKSPTVRFTNENPKLVLKSLEREGIKKVCISGGGGLNSSFIKENLIDEMYLDVEPTLLGKGIKVFADADFDRKLKLLDIKKLSKNEVQLHYKVIK